MTSNHGHNLPLLIFYSVLGLLVFLWSLDLMVSAFQSIGDETVNKVLSTTSNPFISLFIGIFITAVIQSSSTSTSLIVAIVASGSMTLDNAIPMVMGANIGTTLTSTIVSLGYLTNNLEFKRAIAAGVIHDFFNILIVLVVFPLQYYYQILSKVSNYFAVLFNVGPNGNDTGSNWQWEFFTPLNNYLHTLIESKVLIILIACILLFVSIKIISKSIYNNLLEKAKTRLNELFFSNPFKPFGLGMFLTATVQSSSITTSIIIPLAATGSIRIKKLFPYIIGCNIGTTITALIASLYKSEAALSLALAHIILNLIGTALFMLFPLLRNIPVYYAIKFGQMTSRYRIIGFIYVLLIFFLLPLSLIFINKL